MELKFGAIGKVTIRRNYTNSITKEEEYAGVIFEVKMVKKSPLNNEETTLFSMLKLDGYSTQFKQEEVISFKSIKIEKETREYLKSICKQYQNLFLEMEKLKEQEKKIKEINLNIETTKRKLLTSQNILEKHEFLERLEKEFCFEKKDWIVDFSPGSCVCYKANELSLYFYKEIELLGKYQARRSSLVFEEYDNTLFMLEDYENMSEFLSYKKKYEKKFFSKLPIESLCFVGGGDSFYFKCYQKFTINEENLTEKVLQTTIEKLKKLL